MSGSGASGIAFSRDNVHFTTRGMDDTVKLFDIRNFKQHVATAKNFTSYYEETNIIYSPDEKYILTGLSVKRDSTDGGRLMFLNRDTLKIERDVPVGTGSVIRTIWNPRINQIVCSSSDNGTYVLYDPKVSTRGAVMSVNKQVKVQKDDIYFGEYVLIFLIQ